SKFDCGETFCQSIRELCCSVEVDNATCSDRIDNDGNGNVDCFDFSCSRSDFVGVCDHESNCTNGWDDDGDRHTDCNDSDCACTTACNPGCAGDEHDLAHC